ncbi:sensor histidine kinase [Bradyrhizobium sp. AS23.2]|uniref:sensor histidine kinase n=1 Tax=Bradyrhizobium sp. AS23.2 TaxID=1680155 RepID=UPI00093F8EB1|nr:sensor histidine kinase [Bradyrhizobium sp. AS23.2]OKO73205.1 histidine kinase [Bradyrhizobium sp. AS23.2]
MAKLTDEFRKGWQGVAPPSLGLSIAFAAACLLLATLARWGLSHVRPDIYFTPYFPAVLFAATFGGLRIGVITALIGGALGVVLNFGDASADRARFALLAMYWGVSALTIWGVEHYRSMLTEQRRISKRLIEEEDYRKLLVAELQHRLKNKLSTVHAVLHQVLHDQPEVWARIDPRLRSLATADDLISRIDRAGCDIRDLLIAELGPYGHVRFTLNGERLFLPSKLAVTLSLMFHELATNAGKYGAFSAPRGLLQVSWTVNDDRLTVTWDETEGPSIDKVSEPGFGTKLLKSALSAFDGKSEISYLKTGLHCIMQCRIPKSG